MQVIVKVGLNFIFQVFIASCLEKRFQKMVLIKALTGKINVENMSLSNTRARRQ